jgi:hypothetical protein
MKKYYKWRHWQWNHAGYIAQVKFCMTELLSAFGIRDLNTHTALNSPVPIGDVTSRSGRGKVRRLQEQGPQSQEKSVPGLSPFEGRCRDNTCFLWCSTVRIKWSGPMIRFRVIRNKWRTWASRNSWYACWTYVDKSWSVSQYEPSYFIAITAVLH